jgi:hypothetical protein
MLQNGGIKADPQCRKRTTPHPDRVPLPIVRF